MAVSDRDWMREGYNGRQTGKTAGPVVVRALLAVNIVIFLLQMFLPSLGKLIDMYGAYSYYDAFVKGDIWQLLTYQFIHAHVGHITLNMVALWVFGGAVEARFGHGRFLLYYLVCGMAAPLLSSLLGSMGAFGIEGYPWFLVKMVGASGSIYGVIAASAVLFPKARIMLLLPPVELSVRTFALGILALAVVLILFGWRNAGGEAGHLGGMIMGFAIMGVRQLFLMGKRSRYS